MAEASLIEWTDATWSPITGCSVVSPGCTNCYAMRLAGTRLRGHASRAGLTRESKAGPVWTGEVRLNEGWLTQPLQWRRPRKIFVCAHGDLFAEGVPDEWIDRVFAVMALAPQHTFQVLTKRAARMRSYMDARSIDHSTALASAWGTIGIPPALKRQALLRVWPQGGACLGRDLPWPLPNVWLGVSAEDQRRADERIPDLLATPAALRFVSAEPLLGPLDLTRVEAGARGELIRGDFCYPKRINALTGQAGHYPSPTLFHPESHRVANLGWVVVGGESGPGARPMHPDWARSLRDQCAAAGVPFHFKQWGEWAPGECASSSPTRSEKTAEWWGNRWNFASISPRQSAEQHIDNEPDLYRLGKVASGRLLDGVEHNGMPGGATDGT